MEADAKASGRDVPTTMPTDTPTDTPTDAPTDAPTAQPANQAADKTAWKALIASATGYAMDGFDLLILGFMLPAIAQDLHLSTQQSGALVTWTLIGAVAGGIVFGSLSDRHGRIRVLTWTIVLFAVFTGLCAFATGFHDLLAYRTIAGIGLGGEFGIGMALAAEAWPAKYRARASSYVALGWQTGVLAASLLTPLLLPQIGWRGMFLLGVAPAIVAWMVRNSLHEPELFVRGAVQSGRRTNAFRLLVADTATTRASVGIVILCSVQNFGYYGIMIWLPTYLGKTLGFGLTKSALWTSVTIVGMMIGVYLFGQLADRVGRKPVFLLFQAGSVVMVIFYSTLSTPAAMLWSGAVMGLFINGMIGGYGALISEAYPTAARATAQNVLFNIGRAAGGFGPVIVGGLAASYSLKVAIASLAGIYVLDMLATIFLIPELKGVELE